MAGLPLPVPRTSPDLRQAGEQSGLFEDSLVTAPGLRPGYADFQRTTGEHAGAPASDQPFQTVRPPKPYKRVAQSTDWPGKPDDKRDTALTHSVSAPHGIYPLYDFRTDAGKVMYLTARARREKYKITLGSKLTRAMTGELFDTEKIKAFYLAKYQQPYRQDLLTQQEKERAEAKFKLRKAGAPKSYKSFQPFSTPSFVAGNPKIDPAPNSDKAEVLKQLVEEWRTKSLIWVCIDERPDGGLPGGPTFYSHIGRKDYFHHSSFNAAERVLGAGEWIVQDGVLLKISANSGHYQPTVNYLHDCILKLAEACHTETTVLVWEPKLEAWLDVPHGEFKANRETFTAHPRSNIKGSVGETESAGYISQ